MVEQAIEQRGGHHRVAEDLAPFGKATVRGQDHGAAFVAGVDELEEEISAAWHDREIADLVHHEEGGPAEEADPLPELAFPFRARKNTDHVGQGAEVDAASGLD